MATKPTVPIPRWAEDGAGNLSADAVEPPDAKKDVGWNNVREKPNRQHTNWLLAAMGVWLRYLGEEGGALPTFDTLQELIDELDNDQPGVVVKPRADQGFEEAWSVAGGVEFQTVACDGLRVFITTADQGGPDFRAVRAYNADDGTLLWEQTGFSVNDFTRLTCDGARLLAIDGTTSTVIEFDAETGSQTSLALGGSAVVAICTDGVDYFVARANGDVNSYAIGTTTQNWTDSTLSGEVINDLATDGDNLYVAMDYNGGGAAAGVARYLSSTGAHQGNAAIGGTENGERLSVGVDGLVYCSSTAAGNGNGNVYAFTTSLLPVLIELRATTDGTTVGVVNAPDHLIAVAFDQSPVPSDPVLMVCRNPQGISGELAPAWKYTDAVDDMEIASDGDKVYAVTPITTANGNKTLVAFHLPGRARTFVKTVPVDPHRAPFYGLAQPQR